MIDWAVPAEGTPSFDRRFRKLGDPLLDDFRNFQFVCLQTVLSTKPTQLQYDIGDWLAYGPKLRIVMAFRGASKSWQTSFLASWLVLRNWALKDGKPDINIVVTSGTKDRAEGFSSFTRELFVHVEALRPLMPKDPSKWSLSEFNVEGAIPSQVSTVASRAILGRMTGDRADVIIADDLELPQNAETQGQRDKLARRVADFTNILKPGGEIIVLGTPHTEESLYNNLAEQGYHRRIWPGRYPTLDKVQNYGGDLAPYIQKPLLENPSLAGKPVEPGRFDESELQLREAAGRSVFAMQWMLDTTLGDADRYPLKIRDLIVCDLDYGLGPEMPLWAGSPEYVRNDLPSYALRGDAWHRPMGYRASVSGAPSFGPYSGIVLAVDPSGRGSNETAWSTVASLGGYLYLLEHGADTCGYDEPVLHRLYQALQRADCHLVVYEENFGGGMFGALLTGYLTKMGWPCKVEPIRHGSMSKENRIVDSLEPVFNSHKLVVAPRAILDDAPGQGEAGLRKRLWFQVTRMQRVKGALEADDRVDALAMGVAYWTSRLHIVQESFIREREDAARKASLASFWNDLRAFRQESGQAGPPRVLLPQSGFRYHDRAGHPRPDYVRPLFDANRGR